MIQHYERVLPRDLFNEANLLKCLGQLYLLIEDVPKRCTLVHTFSDRPFAISQDQSNGAIACVNVYMLLDSVKYLFWRPLNSHRSFPLYINALDYIDVFTEEGQLTDKFKQFIGYGEQT